jgi:hypothetical protein
MKAAVGYHSEGIQENMRYSKIYASLAAALLMAVSALSSPACAQDTQGPIAPPPKFEVKRIPSSPNAGAPPLPAEQIIRRFAVNEDLFKQAYNSYRLEQTVRVQELDDNGSPSGQFTITDEVYTKADGQRYLRVAKPPESTLRRTAFSLEDVRALAGLPLFFLTADELPHYDLSYEGQEKLDEINTFIFRVKPKQPELGHWLFDGVVWVDDHDIAIVKSYGKFVTQVTAKTPELPFTTFETYRENFAGKYWFPTYTRSDEMLGLKGGSLHLRLVIRSNKVEPQNSANGAGPSAPPTAESSKPTAAKPPEEPQD